MQLFVSLVIFELLHAFICRFGQGWGGMVVLGLFCLFYIEGGLAQSHSMLLKLWLPACVVFLGAGQKPASGSYIPCVSRAYPVFITIACLHITI